MAASLLALTEVGSDERFLASSVIRRMNALCFSFAAVAASGSLTLDEIGLRKRPARCEGPTAARAFSRRASCCKSADLGGCRRSSCFWCCCLAFHAPTMILRFRAASNAASRFGTCAAWRGDFLVDGAGLVDGRDVGLAAGTGDRVGEGAGAGARACAGESAPPSSDSLRVLGAAEVGCRAARGLDPAVERWESPPGFLDRRLSSSNTRLEKICPQFTNSVVGRPVINFFDSTFHRASWSCWLDILSRA